MAIGSSEKFSCARRLANEILLKVETRDAYADALLDHALSNFGGAERDRALLTELVYGTLRWRGKIDSKLTHHLRRPLADTDPRIRNLLRVTLYQLLFLDRIPDYAAVNEAVRLARIDMGGRAAGFVNAVLRNFLRCPNDSAAIPGSFDAVAILAAEHSHPEWLVRRWLRYFGRDGAIALMEANNERPPLVLRVNRCRITREGLLDRFRRNGVRAGPTVFSPQGVWVDTRGPINQIDGFREGLFQVQGEASQLVGYLLSPAPGEQILDACAAPGGKATHIAELMDDTGQVVAIDISERGIGKVKENSDRLRLSSITAARADITQAGSVPSPRPFDRVLLDVPCSGFGTVRSHPEIKWRRHEKDIRRLSELQSKLLERAASLVRRGGVLIYSTCTLISEENDRVVEGFLKTQENFELEDAAQFLPEDARHMLRGRYFLALPSRDRTDGFFAARMKRIA